MALEEIACQLIVVKYALSRSALINTLYTAICKNVCLYYCAWNRIYWHNANKKNINLWHYKERRAFHTANTKLFNLTKANALCARTYAHLCLLHFICTIGLLFFNFTEIYWNFHSLKLQWPETPMNYSIIKWNGCWAIWKFIPWKLFNYSSNRQLNNRAIYSTLTTTEYILQYSLCIDR